MDATNIALVSICALSVLLVILILPKVYQRESPRVRWSMIGIAMLGALTLLSVFIWSEIMQSRAFEQTLQHMVRNKLNEVMVIFEANQKIIASAQKSAHYDANQAEIALAEIRKMVAELKSILAIESSQSGFYASRTFAGPNEFPPRMFPAYGIVAFPSRATSSNRDRHRMICEAYVGALLYTAERHVPYSQQMVTVWPMSTDEQAAQLRAAPRNSLCDRAVDDYGLATALDALKDAQAAGVDTSGQGPFLLAWSPPSTKGQPDIVVLVADLSDVTNAIQADAILRQWALDIESSSELWKDGWHLDKLRLRIMLWADKYGSKILVAVGGKD